MKSELIDELCDMAKDSIGSGDPAYFKTLEEFVKRMRKELHALNRGHQTMYRELRRQGKCVNTENR